jgi:hypothetical protein
MALQSTGSEARERAAERTARFASALRLHSLLVAEHFGEQPDQAWAPSWPIAAREPRACHFPAKGAG